MKKVLFLSLIMVFVFALSMNVGLAKPKTCTNIQSGELLASDGTVIATGFDQWGYNYQGKMFNGYYCDAYRDADWCQPYKEDNLMMKWNDAWLSNKDCDDDGLLDRHYGHDSYIGSGAWLTNHMSGEYEQYVWDVSGEWVIAVNDGRYLHDYVFAMTSLEDGTFSGVGGYPAGSSDYTFDEVVINGQVVGDSVAFTAVYYIDSVPTGYTWNAVGTVDEFGQMTGTGDAGVYEWHSIEGEAQKISEMCYWNYFTKIVAAPDDAYTEAGVWYTAEGVEIGPVIWGSFATIQTVENDSCTGAHGLQYVSPVRAGLGNW